MNIAQEAAGVAPEDMMQESLVWPGAKAAPIDEVRYFSKNAAAIARLLCSLTP